tara:strand:+ start:1043 stop:1615 length:573 start_codon:yes stop_codon:yes gene_type:complete
MSRLRANTITNKTANGAPNFPNGLTGTAGTFTGNLNVGGVLTYEDVTNVDSLGVGTFRDGLRVTGICTATSYRGDGSQLTGISVGITTEAISPSGITTHLLLSSADDHKVLATGNVTIDVTGGTEAASHQIRIENVGVATVGFSTAFQFPSGGTPNLPTASGSLSLISFTVHKTGAAGTTLLAGASVNFS